MRRFFWSLAGLFAALGIAATLELAGVQSAFGVWAHTVPAGVLASIADAMSLNVPANGLILGHAHGPTFLRPMGIVLVYGLPTTALVLILFRGRHRHPSDESFPRQ